MQHAVQTEAGMCGGSRSQRQSIIGFSEEELHEKYIGPPLAGLDDVRIDPRSSLSVQLIHEANFGSERFEPFGPPLRREVEGPWPIRGVDQEVLAAPVAAKPQPCPADVYTCDGRLGPVLSYRLTQEQSERITQSVIREVVVPTTLPTHVAGSLLDVLA